MITPYHSTPVTRHVQALALLTTLAALTTKSLAQQPIAPTAEAQPTIQADPFSFEIGRVAKAGATYTVSATQPASSKLTGQKIRLRIVEVNGIDTLTRNFSLATGKHKTVAQLEALLEGVFRRFLASPAPLSNQELGKVGDLKYGGEVRFVAENSNDLRLDNLAPNEPARSFHYNRADVQALLAAMTSAPNP